jgi:hypothetical protein
MRRRLAAVAVLAVVALAFAARPAQTSAKTPPRVLFIGNSLTRANNLPGMVAAMSAAVGQALECERVTFDGYSLEDHWNRGEGGGGAGAGETARHAIARGGWSTVVLQQGPSALPESRVLLIEYARRFDAEIRRAGARPALYMVWPTTARPFDFDGVRTSYEAAAKAIGGLFLPAGEAWRHAWRLDSRLAFYEADGLHPTMSGTYLAALVITELLTGKSIESVPSALTLSSPPTRVAIGGAEASVLRRAAADTSIAGGPY